MKISDTDHRTNGEAADATGGGKFVFIREAFKQAAEPGFFSN